MSRIILYYPKAFIFYKIILSLYKTFLLLNFPLAIFVKICFRFILSFNSFLCKLFAAAAYAIFFFSLNTYI